MNTYFGSVLEKNRGISSRTQNNVGEN